MVPVVYKTFFNLPDSGPPTNKTKPPSDFNALIVVFGLVVKVHLWTSSLVFTSQKRATDTQQTAETTDKHASWDDQDHGPFPLKMEVENVGATEKAGCSESRLLLTRQADPPLSECALYRQTEQERHFRWRGWMLRPRVIRSPTNPKWERSRVRFPLRAACSFCFLFCRLSFFLSSPVSSPSGFLSILLLLNKQHSA